MRSNNILSIFTGQQSQHLAYHFYHLQAEQIFDEEQHVPKINHKVVWKDLDKHLPRCLVYDLQGNIKLLEHQNRTNNKKIISKLEGQPLGISLVGDFQEQINYKLKAINKKQQLPEEEDQWKQVFDNFDIDQKSLIESGRHSSKKEWDLFYGGKNITRREDEMDKLLDPIRKQLEQEDYTEGFMMFGDISNGFGSINETLITELHNHCPKTPLFFTGINSASKQPSQAEVLNILISYSTFLPICDVFLPINIKSQDYPFFEPREHLEYRSIAPLISNLYYPFMAGNSFGEYIKNITQYRHNNLFNACYTVPLIVEQSLDKLYSVFRYLHPTSNRLNYSRPLVKHNYNPSSRSYSETYVLRGGFNLQPDQVPQMSYIDFKMTDIIFSQKDKLEFSQNYHEVYGKEAGSFPFHSLIFSHECLKGQILQVANSLKSIQTVVLQRYYSEGVQKDQLKEMANQMRGFYDNYDTKGEQSDGES